MRKWSPTFMFGALASYEGWVEKTQLANYIRAILGDINRWLSSPVPALFLISTRCFLLSCLVQVKAVNSKEEMTDKQKSGLRERGQGGC